MIRHLQVSVVVLALTVGGALPRLAGAVCNSSAVRTGYAVTWLQYDSAHDMDPLALQAIPLAWGERGWYAEGYEQTAVSATPTMTVNYFMSNIANKGALNFYTHGSGGGISVAFYSSPSARNAAWGVLQAAHPSWVENTHWSKGSVGEPTTNAWVITIEPSLLPTLSIRSDAYVFGAYCMGFQGAYQWPSMGYYGWQTDCVPQFAMNEFWVRMGCGDFPCVAPDAQSAGTGEGPCFRETVGGQQKASGYNWNLNCDTGCKLWPVYLSTYGAFADTAYCQYVTDGIGAQLVLRGYASGSDYPGNPTLLDSISVEAGTPRTVFVSLELGSSPEYLDWEVRPLVGPGEASQPFEISEQPEWWVGGDNGPAENDEEIYQDWWEPGGGGSTSGSSDSTNCADYVVYATADSLAQPVRSQILSDAPGARVRTILAPDASAASCRTAIGGVLQANKNWNVWCSDYCGRRFPESPGPELYIVGHYGMIKTFEIPDATGACQNGKCASDQLLYDLNDDRLPEGPVSRVIAQYVASATAIVTHAHEFNSGAVVDPSSSLLTMAGGIDSSLYADNLLEDIADQYAAMGYPLRAGLRARDYSQLSLSPRLDACSAALEEGVKEMWWFGGHTNAWTWPGLFAYQSNIPTTTRSQRCIAWLPGCWTLKPGDPGAIAQKWQLYIGGGTRLASVVGSLDVGYDVFHASSARHLADARYAVQMDGVPRSVARIVYDAVRAASAVGEGERTNALTLATWGGLVWVRPRTQEIADLTAGAGRTTGTIGWTEPEQPNGSADEYEIRYQAYTPLTESNFASASLLVSPPSPGGGGTPHCVELSGLGTCRAYYFGIRTKDNGVWSSISNVATASTTCSGSSIAMCMEEGLMGGEGDGGESARRQAPLGTQGTTEEIGPAGTRGNSILTGPPETGMVDIYRLPHSGSELAEGRKVFLWQGGRHRTELDALGMGFVDHPLGTDAIPSRDSVFIGTVVPIQGPIGLNRGEIDERLGPDGAWAVRSGDSLTFVVASGGPRTALVMEARSLSGRTRSDSLGIDVQIPEGRSWRSIARVYPRSSLDRAVVPVPDGREVRLVVLQDCVLQSLNALFVVAATIPAPLAMTTARHSQRGIVDGALDTGGDVVALAPSETLAVDFTPAENAPVGVREYFLTVTGSYETDSAESENTGSELMGGGAIAWSFGLAPARPNPSGGRVSFTYTLARDVRTELRVFDVAGRAVCTLVDADQDAGPHELIWDGRSAAGRKVPAGVYFYRLRAGDWHSERKLIMIQQ